MKRLLVFFALTLPTYAYAYLDPGTGSIIIQGLIAAIVSVIVFFKDLKIRVQVLLKKLFKK